MKRILLLSLLIAVKANAFQPLLTGVDSSGGGNAVVCRDSHKKIKSAEVLDLFEARILYRRQITMSTEHHMYQVHKLMSQLERLNPVGFYSLMPSLSRVESIVHILPPDIVLQPINDSFSPIVPRGCSIEQLAAYQINNELYINGEIWSKLDETNRAAIYAHEALYKTFRQDYGATNSIRVRKIIGALFANTQLEPVLAASSLKTGASYCSAGTIPFGILGRATVDFIVRDHLATLSFITLAGQPVVSSKTLVFDADLLQRPDSGSSHIVMPRPGGADRFEEFGEYFSFSIPDARTIRVSVHGAFGDDSLNETYEFKDCAAHQ